MELCARCSDVLPVPRLGMVLRAVDIDAALPFFIVPLILAVGSTCITATVLVMIVLAMSMLYVMQRPRSNNRTQFFFTWTISSVFYLFLVFELDVLTMLEVTQTENLLFLLLMGGAGWCLHRVRSIVDAARGKDYSPVLTADSFHCPICQIEVNDRYFHSMWLDVCISKANYRPYFIGLSLSNCCLIYATNLGLTTVCQPYILYKTILMPEDCSDVYFDFDLALCFMSCVYGLGYSAVITLIQVHQLFVYMPRYLGLCSRSMGVLSA